MKNKTNKMKKSLLFAGILLCLIMTCLAFLLTNNSALEAFAYSEENHQSEYGCHSQSD